MPSRVTPAVRPSHRSQTEAVRPSHKSQTQSQAMLRRKSHRSEAGAELGSAESRPTPPIEGSSSETPALWQPVGATDSYGMPVRDRCKGHRVRRCPPHYTT